MTARAVSGAGGQPQAPAEGDSDGKWTSLPSHIHTRGFTSPLTSRLVWGATGETSHSGRSALPAPRNSPSFAQDRTSQNCL